MLTVNDLMSMSDSEFEQLGKNLQIVAKVRSNAKKRTMRVGSYVTFTSPRSGKNILAVVDKICPKNIKCTQMDNVTEARTNQKWTVHPSFITVECY